MNARRKFSAPMPTRVDQPIVGELRAVAGSTWGSGISLGWRHHQEYERNQRAAWRRFGVRTALVLVGLCAVAQWVMS